MEPSSITILGGDLRHCYGAEYLLSCGFQVTCFHTPEFPYTPEIFLTDSLPLALSRSDLLLLPSPLSRDENCLYQADTSLPPCPLHDLWEGLTPSHRLLACALPEALCRLLADKGCQVLSLNQSLVFTMENALLTAEGLLSEVIRCTPFSLFSAQVLLLGYGFCGSAIAQLFHPLCRSIYLLEQNEEKQKLAESRGICPILPEELPRVLPQCQILINTIPAPVLNPSLLPRLHSLCHIFDIASAPFGFPEDMTEKFLLPCYRIPGIPGRFAPVTAGELIGKTIERMTEHAL